MEFWSRFDPEEGEHGRLLHADRSQLSYITEHVPVTLRYGWINFSSLSQRLSLKLSLRLLVSRFLNLPLRPTLDVSLFCFLSLSYFYNSLLHYRSNTF